MSIIQPIIVAAGLMALMVLGYLAFSGKSPAKESQRRLKSVRYRYSENDLDRVESQLRKAIAARKPKFHRAAGSQSRAEALAIRLARSGKSWTVSQYVYASLGIALGVTALVYLRSGALFLSLALGVFAGAGIPHLAVNYLIKKRTNAFNAKFADGIELLVRGLRAGLPVAETLSVVANEIPGPVGEEFKAAVERMKIGRTMEESLQLTADKLGTPEFQFFVITLAIQRETGGNLAETRSNLADVVRKRGQMKLKSRAMSAESQASAYIVGALPVIVCGRIWWIKPEYVGGFFVDDRLIVTGLGGLVWMSIGVFIMAKMVSFEI